MDKMLIFMGHADSKTGYMPIQDPTVFITMEDINKITPKK